MTRVDDPRGARILEKLQEDGGRITRPRRMILDVLLSSDEHHLSAADIVEGVRRRDPDFPESTVYRTLARLEELGVIASLAPAGAVTYHVSEHAHVHVVCDACGSVVEHEPDLLGPLVDALRDELQFEVDVHRTMVRGRCRDCAGG